MTGRGCIIGQSGSGKSFLVGSIAEELCKLGLPFCIIDTEGEYAPLKTFFNAMVVGGAKQDVAIDSDTSKLFLNSIKNNVPLVFDVSEEMDKEAKVFKALDKIYQLEKKLRLPYVIIIEEADKFVPQIVHSKINIIEELSVRGRKRGVGLIVATQRPSNISKTVLSQCSYGFIGKLTIQNDLKAIRPLFSENKIVKEIANLSVGEFLPFGVGVSQKLKLRIDRATLEGSTPRLKDDARKASKQDVNKLITGLKESESHPRKTQKGERRIEALALKFSIHEAHVYSRKIAKRSFGFLGRKVEIPDSIKLKYLGAYLCKIRVPTRNKNEFEEYNLLIDNKLRLIRLSKSVTFEDSRIPKPTKLSRTEAEILSQARSRGKVKISKLGLTSSKPSDLRTTIKRLESSKLITRDEKSIRAGNYKRYLMVDAPEHERVNAPIKQLENEMVSQEEARLLTSNLYPNSSIVGFSTLYIPFYEIILRNKNKLRIFKIDGLHGKELPDIFD